ncbi:MAG: prephenate dehydrogenase/arogenate dehydrogenase family protein [Acidobacteria bacterium]|nr:prephenate dehydrogenase/arogenate dehydrogenase family protein [Acidobacteriota bacterium]
MNGHANIVGAGLIGGSIALGLGRDGWTVSIIDSDPARVATAIERGVAVESGLRRDATLTVIATPVSAIVEAARAALADTVGVVTDVGSVKESVVAEIDDPRFVGGHPMAGSELDGLDGADADMFSGAAWVLTPGDSTADKAFATVSAMVRSLGADMITMDARRHDEMVAMVSHVPHLAAVTLMGLASERAEDQGVLLRLAAGGFRDMTRIAAGHPGIWPDICAQNRRAIVETLDAYLTALTELRSSVLGGDSDRLVDVLERARTARLNLPQSAPPAAELSELRIPVLDRRGELAAVATLATDLGINVYDIEIAHSVEGARGVISLIVDSVPAETLIEQLREQGYKPSAREL